MLSVTLRKRPRCRLACRTFHYAFSPCVHKSTFVGFNEGRDLTLEQCGNPGRVSFGPRIPSEGRDLVLSTPVGHDVTPHSSVSCWTESSNTQRRRRSNTQRRRRSNIQGFQPRTEHGCSHKSTPIRRSDVDTVCYGPGLEGSSIIHLSSPSDGSRLLDASLRCSRSPSCGPGYCPEVAEYPTRGLH